MPSTSHGRSFSALLTLVLRSKIAPSLLHVFISHFVPILRRPTTTTPVALTLPYDVFLHTLTTLHTISFRFVSNPLMYQLACFVSLSQMHLFSCFLCVQSGKISHKWLKSFRNHKDYNNNSEQTVSCLQSKSQICIKGARGKPDII